ncbi:MAG: Sporulation protein [Lachnoclostridium sp.]|jgi:germination protein M
MKEKKKQIKINRTGFLMIVLLLMAVSLGACSQKKESEDIKQTEESEYAIYYVDKNETKIVSEPYTPISTEKEDLVKELFEALGKEPKDISLKSAKPKKLKAKEFKFNEDNDGLSIDFNSEYSSLSGISEVLFRACVVKTLCQIKGVDDIEFYVEGQPLKGLNDQPVSFMKADDFIDDTSAEKVYVTVYFANKKGNKLVPVNLKISMDNGNSTVEKLIVESLISGPENVKNIDDIDVDVKKTVPNGTKLLNISTIDGICYVDLNEKFLEKTKGVKDGVVIYSIVNSLAELSTINKVKFTINGEVKKTYRDDIAFDQLFERNLELVEGSK